MADWDPFERADSFHEDVSSAVMVAVPEQPPTENVQPCGPSGDSTNDVAAKGWSERVPFTYADYNSTEFTEWAGSAKRYEWSDEYGDVGPKNEELEKQLFNVENMTHAGLKLDRLNKIDVRTESEERVCPVTNWEDAGLHPIVKENISLCLYAAPTAIQMYAIPAMLMDKDLIAISQTGSGKTGAYLIPILSKLMGKAKKLAAPRPNAVEVNFNPKTDGVRAEPLVLVVCPTRELATQIFDDARRLCYRSMLRPCVAYGGVPSRLQREELQRGCDILIGTPGRIIDFMGQGHVLSLRRVKFTVVDEADELLHADWEDDFKKIMSGGDATEDDDHRYMMFSATFNKECRMLARDYLGTNHIRIRIGRPGSSHLNVEQQVIYVEDAMKNKALYDLLLSMCPIRTLVFVNSKAQVDYVDDYLYNAGLPSTSIHGDRTQREREDAIRAFKTAKCPIMVATGLSARGLDIANIMHVVNYDLPKAVHGGITEYVHRIGRTARIGNEGLATSFYSDKDKDIAFDLVKILLECDQKVPEFLQDYTPTDNCPVFADDDTDVETDQDEDDQDEEKQDKVNQDGNDTWGQSSASVGEQEAPFAPENTSRNNGIGGSNWATAGVTL